MEENIVIIEKGFRGILEEIENKVRDLYKMNPANDTTCITYDITDSKVSDISLKKELSFYLIWSRN